MFNWVGYKCNYVRLLFLVNAPPSLKWSCDNLDKILRSCDRSSAKAEAKHAEKLVIVSLRFLMSTNSSKSSTCDV